MSGRVIGHYRIREEIGSGGMGVVHLAHDEHLKRRVALKFLPPSTVLDIVSRQRLRREALALSRLAHPSIATLYDFISEPDLDCIVMEYVEGESVDKLLERGPVAESEVIRLGVQLADGLAAAHAAGVIHRDLKPGNLRINTEGRLKILDFGLAKRVGRSLDSTSVANAEMPEELTGTFPYIAPELWRGEAATPRTDLYATGVVLYELATGARPFPDLTGSALVRAVMDVDPAPARVRRASIGPELDAIIMRCLARDPGQRFASAKELHDALEGLRSARLVRSMSGGAEPRKLLPSRRVMVGAAALLSVVTVAALWVGHSIPVPGAASVGSIAVLPFSNLSGDPAQEYFVDGMTDELTSRLAESQSVRVISRTSMMRYKSTTMALPEIARQVGADRVVQGSVQFQGDQVRISVQLIDGPRDRHLWSQHYPGRRDDAQDVQQQMVEDLERALGVPAKPNAPARHVPVHVDPVAYNLYLHGRFHLDRRDLEGIRRAIGYFESAIHRDSTYAPAYAGLADAWSTTASSGFARPGDAYPQARQSALRAIALDPQLSEGHVSLANIQQNYDWDWNAAAASYRKGLELNANNAVAHHWYANHLALRGEFNAANQEIHKAQELDPFSLPIRVGVAVFLYFARQYPEAERAYRLAAEQGSSSGLLQRAMAANDDKLGRDDKAIPAICAWLESEHATELAHAVALAYRQGGMNGALRLLIAGMVRKRQSGAYEPATHIAELYSRMGDREAAFHWLAIAERERDTELNRLKVDPIFDPLRGDPRFDELLRHVGLADLPKLGGT